MPQIVQNIVETEFIEVAAFIQYTGTGTGKVAAFTVEDWVLENSQYYLDLRHNLETEYVSATFKDESNIEVSADYVPYTSNIIRVYVPAEPDLRFAGKCLILKIWENKNA